MEQKEKELWISFLSEEITSAEDLAIVWKAGFTQKDPAGKKIAEYDLNGTFTITIKINGGAKDVLWST